MARSAVTKGRLAKVGQDIGVTGLDEIKAAIAAKLDKLTGQKAKQVFMKAAMIGVTEIKDIVPVKTGNLRDSIFAVYGDPKKPNVLVGVDHKKAPYDHIVEFKTPYFRPGITAARPAMAATIAEGLRDLAEEQD